MDLLSSEDLMQVLKRYAACCNASGEACIDVACIDPRMLEWRTNKELQRTPAFMAVQDRKIQTVINDPLSHFLPPEVISHIFEFSVSRHFSALNLGAVCVAWRNIAWATPRLWTHIAINLDATKFPTRGIVALEWLNRSGCLPLHISLTAAFTCNEDSWSDQFYPLVETINALSHRWRVVSLELPIDIMQHIRPTSASKIASILHTLQVKSPDTVEDTDEGDDNEYRDILTATNLSPIVVHIDDLPFQSINFQCNRMTTLWLDDGTLFVNDFIELFNTAPRLVTLFVDSIKESFEPPTRPSQYGHQLVHSTLTDLRFGCESSDNLTRILNTIDLPALQHLELFYRGPTWVPGDLRSFIQRSRCSLKYLSMSVEDIEWTEILSLLHATPSVERLDLGDFSILPGQGTNQIFQHFRMHCCKREQCQEKTTFLPNLRRLSFNSESIDTLEGRNWAAVIYSLDRLVDDLYLHNRHQDFHLRQHKGHDKERHNDFHKVDLSISMLIDLSQRFHPISKSMIPRFINILELGVALDITTEVVSQDNTTYMTTDVIQESMRFHGYSNSEIEKYIALANSRRFADKWEPNWDLDQEDDVQADRP